MSDDGLDIPGSSSVADASRYRPYRPDLGDDFFSLMRCDRGFSYSDALGDVAPAPVPTLDAVPAPGPEGAPEGAPVLEGALADTLAPEGAPAPEGVTERASEGAQSLFWPGCTLSSYSQELTDATFRFLEERGIVDGLSIRCCGNVIRYAGGRAACTDYRDGLVALLRARGIQRIVTACPNCYQAFREMLQAEPQPTPQPDSPLSPQPTPQPDSQPAIEVLALSPLLAKEGVRIPLDRVAPATTVCIHDSCPDRRLGIDAAAVRGLFEGVELREMEHSRGSSRCCGLGRLQFVSNPQASRCQRAERIREFEATGADQLVTFCFSCTNSLQDPAVGISALHYLELVFDVRIDWPAVYQSSTRALAAPTPASDESESPAPAGPAPAALEPAAPDPPSALEPPAPAPESPAPAPGPPSARSATRTGSATKTVKSNCHYCGYLCGFLATVASTPEGERLTGLAPDPSRYPYDERITNGCHRWRMNLEQIDAPERLNHPLRRVGERGSGQWERVTWDEALDDIAARLKALASAHGPQTLASAIGGPHASYWPLHRFLNLFGSPNNMGIGQICWNIRIWMDCLSYGWPIEVNIDPNVSGAVFLWGTNPAESDNLLFWRTLLTMDKARTPLVVIDPRTTRTARIATLHLAPRPGTDCTLALALIREIIVTRRIDHDFVERWCHGFDELVAHVEPYTPAYAERVTGVPAASIVEAARLFSQPKPTALLSGRGIDQLGPNTAPTHRAISILRAITGDVDRPGACLIEGMSDFIPEVDLEMSAWLSPEHRATQLNIGHSALQSYPGYEGASRLTGRFGKRLPMRYLTSAHPNLVWRAVVTGKPYPVRALICMAANPLVTYADTRLVHQALSSLDLLVVLEYYLTPTAQLADYVLPSAGAFERPLIQAHGGIANFCYGGAAALAPYHERRADYDFFRSLGIRLGQAEHWPDATLQQAIERTLAPAGVTWEQWARQGIYCGPAVYHKQEFEYAEDVRLDDRGPSGGGTAPGADRPRSAPGGPQGFATTTGRLELANEYLDALGGGRLPVPVPVPSEAAYPFTMISGARMQPYWASSYFNNPRFRAMHPEPTAQMSATTLAAAGLADGQWVEVATARGSARFKAEAAEIVDGVVSVEYGWWYPEEEQGEPHLSGVWRSNVNVLTSADIEDCEPLIGTWSYNAIPCALRPL